MKKLVASLLGSLSILSSTSSWGQTQLFDSYALEGRTFCSKENGDWLDAFCISFVNGHSVFTLKDSWLMSPVVSSSYELTPEYAHVAAIGSEHIWQFAYASDNIYLSHKAGDLEERFENPRGSYWFESTQMHYLFVDGSELSQDVVLRFKTNSDECKPESPELRVEAGSRKTHLLELRCGQSDGTYLIGDAIESPMQEAAAAFDYSTLQRHQIKCGDQIEGLCGPYL